MGATTTTPAPASDTQPPSITIISLFHYFITLR
jgi:hypothetical protein